MKNIVPILLIVVAVNAAPRPQFNLGLAGNSAAAPAVSSSSAGFPESRKKADLSLTLFEFSNTAGDRKGATGSLNSIFNAQPATSISKSPQAFLEKLKETVGGFQTAIKDGQNKIAQDKKKIADKIKGILSQVASLIEKAIKDVIAVKLAPLAKIQQLLSEAAQLGAKLGGKLGDSFKTGLAAAVESVGKFGTWPK